MDNQNCSKCGKNLSPGSLKYILSIKLYADFDGWVEPSGEGDRENLEYLVECLESTDQDEIEDDVHQEMAFLLCKNCRDLFSRNPLNRNKDTNDREYDYNGRLH